MAMTQHRQGPHSSGQALLIPFIQSFHSASNSEYQQMRIPFPATPSQSPQGVGTLLRLGFSALLMEVQMQDDNFIQLP